MTFIDKKNREIKIKFDDLNVFACHEGKKIGQIQFDDREHGIILYGMDVDDDYRRSGIAYEMMKMAVEYYGDSFGKPNFNAYGGKHANAEDYYTQEGAAFILYCIKSGLLKDTDYEENAYDDEF